MSDFYFTYGLKNYPYKGGWTRITAPSMNIAMEIFMTLHPSQAPVQLNCTNYYKEREFKSLELDKTGVLGKKEWEHITIERKDGTK